MYRVTFCYTYDKGLFFSEENYLRHMRWVQEVLGPCVKRFAVGKGVGLFGAEPVYSYVGTFFVDDLDAFNKAFLANKDMFYADIPNYSMVSPMPFAVEGVC